MMNHCFKNALISAVVLAAAGFLWGASAADSLDDVDSFRCGSRLVVLHDRKFEVAEKCGDPDRIRSLSYWREVWMYNPGPNEFVRYLTFVNGKLHRIQVGGYGW